MHIALKGIAAVASHIQANMRPTREVYIKHSKKNKENNQKNSRNKKENSKHLKC